MDESKERNEGQLFEDLIGESSSIASLNIEERNLQDFQPALAAAEAAGPKPQKKVFGKRAKRNLNTLKAPGEVLNISAEDTQELKIGPEPVSFERPVLKRSESKKSEPEFNVISPFGNAVNGRPEKSAIELLREEREAEKRKAAEAEAAREKEILEDAAEVSAIEEEIPNENESENVSVSETETGISPEESEEVKETLSEIKEKTGLSVSQDDVEAAAEEKEVVIEQPEEEPEKPAKKPSIFARRSSVLKTDAEKKKFEEDRHIEGNLSADHLNGKDDKLIDQNDPSLTNTITSLNLQSSAAASALLEAHQNDDDDFEDEEDENDRIFDPSASLVDDYDYNLYQDRKHFLMSDYKKMEDYLEAQARQGYHYVSHEGKKFFFHKGIPTNEYYEAMYFTKEPVESQWENWRDEGWEFVHRTEGKKKSDFGWIIFRHPEEPGQFRREIENNQEKYRFFRKYANSCRSTLFVLFICLVTSVVTAFLQWQFKGYLAGIIFCGVVFVVSLYFCIVYARMLTKSRKQARLLKARIRRLKNEKQEQISTEESSLDEDWNEIDEDEASEDEDE